jgi:hypothetical protein
LNKTRHASPYELHVFSIGYPYGWFILHGRFRT